jgi:hypothetical protein
MPSGSLPPGKDAGLPRRSTWYVDTALHQAVTPNADFQFVNIGRWQTAEDFQTATQSPGFGESVAGLAGTGHIRTLLAGRPRGDWNRAATCV